MKPDGSPEPYEVQGCHAPHVVHGGVRNAEFRINKTIIVENEYSDALGIQNCV